MITALTFWFVSGLLGLLLMRLQLKLKGEWRRNAWLFGIPLVCLGFFFFLSQTSEVQEELLSKKRKR